MRKAFTGLAILLLLAVVVQFFLAASGAFDTAPNVESFQPHRLLGYGIVLVAVLMTLVAAVTRMPGRVIGMAGLVAGLALVQSVIRVVAKAFGEPAGQLVFGVHAVNGLVIMAAAAMIVRQTRELSRSTTPAQPAS
jgi:hypothetical protein